jgi:shikimate kinase
MQSFKEHMELQEGVNDPAIFKAIFLAGGPGSGKSFTVGKTALPALGFRIVNSDDAFEAAMNKIGKEMNPENIFSDEGQELRNKAKKLTNLKLSLYLDGRLGVVIDGTGKDYQKIKKQAIQMEALGYETAMIFVNTDVKTAVDRDAARNRSVGEKVTTQLWNEVQSNIGKFQAHFEQNLFIVDNSTGSDIEKGSMRVYKKMQSWAKTSPKNFIAQKWIKSQKKS